MNLFGRGLLARSFAPHFEGDPGAVIFASGVSDSTCIDEGEYAREEKLLRQAIEDHAQAKLFLYFSTCSIFDPSASESHYVKHKRRMEDLVSRHEAHLVLRLPIVIGAGGNPRALVRHLAERIASGQVVEVWKNAGRYLIDIEDVVAIGRDLVARESAINERINVSAPHDTALPELVAALGRVVGKEPLCRYVERGSRYVVDTGRIRNSLKRQGIRFDDSYVERVLRKYYGSAPEH
jgi:nucleoside-diphosphate-sugar epimerase